MFLFLKELLQAYKEAKAAAALSLEIKTQQQLFLDFSEQIAKIPQLPPKDSPAWRMWVSGGRLMDGHMRLPYYANRPRIIHEDNRKWYV